MTHSSLPAVLLGVLLVGFSAGCGPPKRVGTTSKVPRKVSDILTCPNEVTEASVPLEETLPNWTSHLGDVTLSGVIVRGEPNCGSTAGGRDYMCEVDLLLSQEELRGARRPYDGVVLAPPYNCDGDPTRTACFVGPDSSPRVVIQGRLVRGPSGKVPLLRVYTLCMA